MVWRSVTERFALKSREIKTVEALAESDPIEAGAVAEVALAIVGAVAETMVQAVAMMTVIDAMNATDVTIVIGEMTVTDVTAAMTVIAGMTETGATTAIDAGTVKLIAEGTDNEEGIESLGRRNPIARERISDQR